MQSRLDNGLSPSSQWHGLTFPSAFEDGFESPIRHKLVVLISPSCSTGHSHYLGPGCTPAEVGYGTTLKLPGQMVAPRRPPTLLDSSSYVHRLQEHMSSSSLVTTQSQRPTTQVPRGLLNCTHIFVRCDACCLQTTTITLIRTF